MTRALPTCADCGAESTVLFPGDAGEECELFNTTMQLRRGTRSWGLCLPHAKARGWPGCYAGERVKHTRGARA